ncbi:MAG: hypothetical protein GY714_28095 [Desulfobacterales bacterium]|nr:hypothetical protein [Desulfobacterales bacterium]
MTEKYFIWTIQNLKALQNEKEFDFKKEDRWGERPLSELLKFSHKFEQNEFVELTIDLINKIPGEDDRIYQEQKLIFQAMKDLTDEEKDNNIKKMIPAFIEKGFDPDICDYKDLKKYNLKKVDAYSD